ncbi:peptidylprolyl isomerase, partial [bacterium]|nr:peptidylprolyl isomerase [bacterium]
MKVLFNVNPKVAGLTAQNVHKNNQAASLAQSQTSITPASFKGAEAVKSILQAQENMRVPKTVTGIISFKGNPAKNNNQIASIASEYQGLPPEFNDMYKIGGLANVAGEASVAFQKEGMDIRTFIPYHSVYKKADGEVVKAEGKIFVYNEQDKSMKKEDPTKYTLGQGEKFVLVAGVQTDDNTPPKMLTLKPTGITGSVPYLDEVDSSLAQKEDKYALFELEREKPTDPKIYVVHTEGLAKLTKAYGSDDGGAYFSNFDREYSSFTRAIVGEILPAMSGAKKEEAKDDAAETAEENATENAVEGAEKDTVEGEVKAATEDTEKDAVEGEVEAAVEGAEKDTVEGETKDTKEEAIEEKDPSVFNPAGYWLHDRFAFPAMLEASRRAADGDNYFSGLRMHATYHNPGRDYQGHYDNPLDFIKTIGAVEILDTIAQDKPEEAKRVVNYIEQIKEYKTEGDNDPFTPMQKILTKEEYADLEKIFEPYIGQFKDEKGSYNMSLIPFVATNTNKGNFTHGTVSMNYGKEMVDLDTPEIAYGITSILKKDAANMVNITNGSYAVSLGLFKPGFGNADVLNKAEGYTWLIRGEKDQEAIFKNLQEHNKKAEEKAKKEAEKIIKELEDGADFAELAKKYSDDEATAKNGGSLGKFSPDDMVEQFAAA